MISPLYVLQHLAGTGLLPRKSSSTLRGQDLSPVSHPVPCRDKTSPLRNDHVSLRGPNLFLRPCQTSCLMSVLVVHICSYGPVRRHVSCQSSWSKSVLTGLFGVMTYVSLVVQICSYGPVRRHNSCQSSWSKSVLTGLSDVTSHVSPRGPHLFSRPCQTSCLMSVLAVQICSYGPVRRHDLCQSSWSKSVLTALLGVMTYVSPRGPNLFSRPCQTSCLMSVLVVQICSYGPVRRHDLCQSSWSKSVLTALLGVMTYVSPRGPNLFLWPCQTSCLMSVLVVHICSYGPVRRHVSCQSSWSTSVLTALSDVMSHVSPRGPNLFLRPC
ncbi:hypothetical protein RRG08_061801 [Elysia crispata]|uniref:Uncharacterized protein n=1 Tax=Elysia crispata TaxID=231223 RepID=A0AAE1AB84_9GAST|nr:hypothetical protein RRG08_061801 [Elysia crispata]